MLVFRDSTKRKKAEEKLKQAKDELKKSEERYQDLYENAPDMFLSVDAKTTNIVKCNQTVATNLGYTKKEIIGRHIFEMYHPDCMEDVKKAFQSFRETGEIHNAELQVKRKDGTKIDVILNVSSILDEQGNILHSRSIWRDITIRKRAENAQRESEERFRTLFEMSRDAIMFASIDGRILNVNQAFLDMLNYTKNEIQACNFQDFTPKKWEAMENKIIENQILKRGYSDVYEKEYIQKDGTIIPIEIRTGLLRAEAGNPGQMFGVVRDISERKQTEEELRRRENLAVLGQLAAGVGHELRNPLAAIKTAVYFLKMILEESEEEVQKSLDVLENEVAISTKIISSLLDFARPKPLKQRKIDVNEVIQTTLSHITAPEMIKVVTQLDETVPFILADLDQLTQVFGNIISNAIQAMPEGGQLFIKSEVSSLQGADISFADSGVGIPQETMEKIFEPLFTTKAKGIGLGLAVAKTLVEGHGGRIEVESKVGKGSTFTVRLPCSRTE